MDSYRNFENPNDAEKQAIQEEIKAQARNRYYNASGMAAVGAFFKNMVNFKGRSSRREFWWSMLFLGILVFGLMLILIPFTLAMAPPGPISIINLNRMGWTTFITNIVFLILGLPLVIAQCSLFLRRLRDVGHGKWLVWVYVAFLILTQILSLTSAYQLATIKYLLALSASRSLTVIGRLGIASYVVANLSLLLSLAMTMVALFPNKPFAIKDGFYESNGKRLRVWSKQSATPDDTPLES